MNPFDLRRGAIMTWSKVGSGSQIAFELEKSRWQNTECFMADEYNYAFE